MFAKGNGSVELKGPVLAREAGQVLSAVARVPGVRMIDDDLERHARADLPALQAEPPKHSELARLWTPATRLVLGLGAAAFALASLIRGNPAGFILGGASMLGLARSSTRGNPNPFRRVSEGGREASREPPAEGMPGSDGPRSRGEPMPSA